MQKTWLVSLNLVWILGCGSPAAPAPTTTPGPAQAPASQPPKQPAGTASQPAPPAVESGRPGAPPKVGSEVTPEREMPEPAARVEPTEAARPEAEPTSPAPAEPRDAENQPDRPAAEPAAGAATPVRFSAEWAETVTADDLTEELVEVFANTDPNRLSANLKKQADFDKHIKDIKAEAHLAAILSEAILAHPNAGDWRGVAADVQRESLELAGAAEVKGVKSFRAAQASHKKIKELLDKAERGETVEAPPESDAPDWVAVGDKLSHPMKQVDRSYKFIRGSMSKATFEKKADQIRHDAAIIMTIAEIAPAFRPGEQDFVPLSKAMRAAARDQVEAAQKGDFESAQQAYTAINLSCQNCHMRYRLDQVKNDFDF